MSAEFVEHHGSRILLMDFSDEKHVPTLLAKIEEARQVVAAQPKRKELLVLVDVHGLTFNDQIIQAFRTLIRDDEPWERAVAVCGFSALGKIAFRAVNLTTGSRLQAVDSRDDGMDWLVKQKAAPS
jgi:hypothetical protein